MKRLLLSFLVMTFPLRAEPIWTTAQFLDSIRFVAHAGQRNTVYADPQIMIDSLRYLGSRHLRVPDLPEARSVFQALCAKGVKLLLLQDQSPSLTEAKIFGRDCLDGVEGPNEINDTPARHHFAGKSGLPAILLHQRALFNQAQAWDPTLPVLTPSQSVGRPPIGPDMSDMATVESRHYYMSQSFPPQAGRGMLADSPPSPRKLPFWMTETGYANPVSGPNEMAQAILILDTLMDSHSFGTKAIYVYQLFDVCADTRNVECMFGMFRFNPDPEARPAPKRVATAIHNMTSILADHGARPPSKPVALDITWSGLLPNQFMDQLAGPNGDVWIMVRDESAGGPRPPLWDLTNLTVRAVKPNDVTATFRAPHQFTIYDPVLGPTPVQPYEIGESLHLSLGYLPLLVHVTPPY